MLEKDIERVLISREELNSLLDRLAEKINNDYNGRRLIAVGILKGAAVFYADVVRRLDEARCMVVEDYPERPDGTPCKDANEILYFHCAEALKETLNSAAPVPVKGIIQ